MYLALYLVLSIGTLMWLVAGQTNIQCPKNCVCSASGQKLRLKCGGSAANKIVSIKEIDFGEIEADVEQLDLSKNQIIYIEPDVFLNMTSLKKLDLTSNLLKQIDEATFGELASLERLKLSSNLIAHIFQGAFEKMKNLKQM
jgi:Leucine-rich repeat (LRR) protein